MTPSNAFAAVAEAGNAHGRARDYLLRQIAEDDPAFADTLEGMTELPELIDKLMLHARARKAEAEGLDVLINELLERKRAGIEYEKRAREVVREAMESAGEKTLRCASGTYTVTTTRGKIDIPDPAAVPHDYCNRVVTWKPDREKIEADIDKGLFVNWATRLPPGTTLTVRKK